MMWVYIIIYIVGYIAAYYSIRFAFTYRIGKYWDWDDVINCLLVSFLSYIGIIVALGLIASAFVDQLRFKCKSSKPPRWL